MTICLCVLASTTQTSAAKSSYILKVTSSFYTVPKSSKETPAKFTGKYQLNVDRKTGYLNGVKLISYTTKAPWSYIVDAKTLGVSRANGSRYKMVVKIRLTSWIQVMGSRNTKSNTQDISVTITSPGPI